MTKWMRVAVVAGLAAAVMAVGGTQAAGAVSSAGGVSVEVQQTGTQLAYVVFHAVDRDGFCDAAAFGAVSLHPVLTDAPNDTMINGATGLPNPRATLDVYIDSGDGVILDTSDGPAAGARSVSGLHTFSTYDNANSATPIKAFPPLDPNAVDECQAWVEVVSSLGQAGNVLMIFHDDTGDIGFDKIVNGPAATSPATSSDTTQASMTLSPGWSLVTWSGGDGVAPGDGAQFGAVDGGRWRRDRALRLGRRDGWVAGVFSGSRRAAGCEHADGAEDRAGVLGGGQRWGGGVAVGEGLRTQDSGLRTQDSEGS